MSGEVSVGIRQTDQQTGVFDILIILLNQILLLVE
jgi:hypothetical protein